MQHVRASDSCLMCDYARVINFCIIIIIIIRNCFGLGQEVVQNSFFIRILTKGAWEIAVPYGLLNDGLQPVLFVSCNIPPPGRACIKELRDQCSACYVETGIKTQSLQKNLKEILPNTTFFTSIPLKPVFFPLPLQLSWSATDVAMSLLSTRRVVSGTFGPPADASMRS